MSEMGFRKIKIFTLFLKLACYFEILLFQKVNVGCGEWTVRGQEGRSGTSWKAIANAQ